jgi:hypothetical protein
MKWEKAICAASFVFLLAALSGCTQPPASPAPPSGAADEIGAVKSVQLPEGWRLDFRQGAQLGQSERDSGVFALAEFSQPDVLCKVFTMMGTVGDRDDVPHISVVFYRTQDVNENEVGLGVATMRKETASYLIDITPSWTVCRAESGQDGLFDRIQSALRPFIPQE